MFEITNLAVGTVVDLFLYMTVLFFVPYLMVSIDSIADYSVDGEDGAMVVLFSIFVGVAVVDAGVVAGLVSVLIGVLLGVALWLSILIPAFGLVAAVFFVTESPKTTTTT